MKNIDSESLAERIFAMRADKSRFPPSPTITKKSDGIVSFQIKATRKE